MTAEVGEELVGAYLAEILKCDHVSYNVRPPGGGLEGLDEIDVVGLRFQDKTAFLCEVATNILGYMRKSPANSAIRISKKLAGQKRYAHSHLASFPNRHFMFWSPRISSRELLDRLGKIPNLELIINADYSARVIELRRSAKVDGHPTSNSAYRMLQILEHLRPAM